MKSRTLLLLLYLLLLISCKKKEENSVVLKTEQDQQQTERDALAVRNENNNDNRRSVSVEPLTAFPLPEWLINRDIGNFISPYHPSIGALPELNVTRDAKELLDLSEQFFQKLPDQDSSQYYPAIKDVLYLKIEEMNLANNAILGRPDMGGRTAEVAFYNPETRQSGFLYWIFEGNWYLENLDLN